MIQPQQVFSQLCFVLVQKGAATMMVLCLWVRHRSASSRIVLSLGVTVVKMDCVQAMRATLKRILVKVMRFGTTILKFLRLWL